MAYETIAIPGFYASAAATPNFVAYSGQILVSVYDDITTRNVLICPSGRTAFAYPASGKMARRKKAQGLSGKFRVTGRAAVERNGESSNVFSTNRQTCGLRHGE